MDEMPESSYIGRHAELYDLFYADKPYNDEVSFLHSVLQNYGNPKRVLELACGTGTHSLLLEKLGYQIIATDYSQDMLNQAKQKAQNSDSLVDFRFQNMISLNLDERPFDAILCLFDSIGYVQTNENLKLVLKGVHDHLQSGGLFVFEFWHAGAMIRSYDPLRIRRWKTPEGEIIRISETTIDFRSQLCNVNYSIFETQNKVTYNLIQETQTNRFFLVQEMANLLSYANLSPIKWFAGFTNDESISENVWHIVCVAKKNSGKNFNP